MAESARRISTGLFCWLTLHWFTILWKLRPDGASQIPAVQAFVDTSTGLPVQALSILLSLSFGYILLVVIEEVKNGLTIRAHQGLVNEYKICTVSPLF